MQDKDENEDFEDLDFEDLDADDDFDESWDDFDDVDDAEDMADTPAADVSTEEPSGKTDEAPAQKDAAAGPKKKSFIQKNFNLIVIGIAVLGGGSFVLSKLAAPPANQGAPQAMGEMGDTAAALTEPPAEIPELSGDMPPMPAPMDASAEAEIPELSDELADLDLSLEDTADLPSEEPETLQDSPAPLPESDDVLTPLPELSESTDNAGLDDLGDLADLDLSLEDTAEDVVPATEEEATLDISSLDDLPEDIAVEDPSAALNLDSKIEETGAPQTQDTLEIDPAPTLDESVSEIQFEDTALEEVSAVEAAMPDADTQALESEVQALNESMSEKESALDQASEEKAQLSMKLDEAQSKISTLESKIAELEAELKTAKAAPMPAPEKAEPAAPEVQAPEKVEVESTPAAALGTQAEKPVAAKPVSWVLRSAQPGIATLSSKDSNDLRRVEVGDVVSSLGRIQSISVEDGKWVVRGSKGHVTQ